MKLSRRVRELSPSATLQAKSDAERLRREGVEVVDFGPGEPDFDTPDPIKNAAKLALDQNFTHYTETAGIPELRAAIAERYRTDHGTDYTEDEVFTGCGAKNILFLLAQAVLDPGDRVGIFAPYWVSFPDQVRLAGAEPVILPTREEDRFIPRAEILKKALESSRLQAVILNSPCNPTGAVMPADELSRFAALAKEHDLLLVSDETYEFFFYGDGTFPSLAPLGGGIRDHLLVVGSFSKSYAMTGWRVGFALGPRPLIAALTKIQSHDATHTASFAMKGALAALRAPRSVLDRMREEGRLDQDARHVGPQPRGGNPLPGSGRRFLRLPECERTHAAPRLRDIGGSGPGTPPEPGDRHRGRLRIRRRGVSPAFLCPVTGTDR